jgi:hypothetical protein
LDVASLALRRTSLHLRKKCTLPPRLLLRSHSKQYPSHPHSPHCQTVVEAIVDAYVEPAVQAAMEVAAWALHLRNH